MSDESRPGVGLTAFQLWYGRDEAPIRVQRLRAGPVGVQRHGPDLRYARLGPLELVRRLYVAVRDRDWNTVPGECTNVTTDVAADHFRCGFDVRHRQADIDFAWHGEVRGDADGTLVYAMEGAARSAFLYSRIGINVLHAAQDTAGRRYRAEGVAGHVSGTMPRHITPRTVEAGRGRPTFPFPPFHRLSLDLRNDTTVRFAFEGELFEMEDQRNWTDDSFKTYAPPMAVPSLLRARSGQRFRQSVTISVEARPTPVASPRRTHPAVADERSATIRVRPGQPLGRKLPPIGLGMPSHDEPLSASQARLLAALKLDHLRVDLHLGVLPYADTLRRAHQAADALHCSLELGVHVTDEAATELAQLAPLLAQVPGIARVLVFKEEVRCTDQTWVGLARAYLGEAAPDAAFAGGTNGAFANLNRHRPRLGAADLVVYPISPQVHAFDEASMAETLATQAATIATTRRLYPRNPVVVSRITLKPPARVVTQQPAAELAPDTAPASADPRQASLFGAGWTLGSLKYLAESGAQALTYFETTGWLGIMGTERGAPATERPSMPPGRVFPMYHVFADLAEYRAADLLRCRSSNRLAVDALALRQGDRLRLLLANLTAAQQRVAVSPLKGARCAIRRLAAETASIALAQPERFRATCDTQTLQRERLLLDMAPYAVVCIDVAGA